MKQRGWIFAAVLLVGCAGPGSAFDAERWLASPGCVIDSPRLGMVRDLTELLERERPTGADVERLLGAPEGRTAESLAYSVGYNIIDCDSIRIEFGADGRVEQVVYVQG